MRLETSFVQDDGLGDLPPQVDSSLRSVTFAYRTKLKNDVVLHSNGVTFRPVKCDQVSKIMYEMPRLNLQTLLPNAIINPLSWCPAALAHSIGYAQPSQDWINDQAKRALCRLVFHSGKLILLIKSFRSSTQAVICTLAKQNQWLFRFFYRVQRPLLSWSHRCDTTQFSLSWQTLVESKTPWFDILWQC